VFYPKRPVSRGLQGYILLLDVRSPLKDSIGGVYMALKILMVDIDQHLKLLLFLQRWRIVFKTLKN